MLYFLYREVIEVTKRRKCRLRADRGSLRENLERYGNTNWEEVYNKYKHEKNIVEAWKRDNPLPKNWNGNDLRKFSDGIAIASFAQQQKEDKQGAILYAIIFIFFLLLIKGVL